SFSRIAAGVPGIQLFRGVARLADDSPSGVHGWSSPDAGACRAPASALRVAAVGTLPVAFRESQPALDHAPHRAAGGALQLVLLVVEQNHADLLHLTL